MCASTSSRPNEKTSVAVACSAPPQKSGNTLTFHLSNDDVPAHRGSSVEGPTYAGQGYKATLCLSMVLLQHDHRSARVPAIDTGSRTRTWTKSVLDLWICENSTTHVKRFKYCLCFSTKDRNAEAERQRDGAGGNARVSRVKEQSTSEKCVPRVRFLSPPVFVAMRVAPRILCECHK